MTDTLADKAREIGFLPYNPAEVHADQKVANAAESIAIQLDLINRKFDLLIEAIERASRKP